MDKVTGAREAMPAHDGAARVADVTKKSAGWRCGLRPGDRLLAINGQPLRDAIDVQIYGGEPRVVLDYEREGESKTCTVRRRYGEPLGISFCEDLFDGPPRVCRNRCTFCFVAQMAPGLRAPLYIKDDDYRLSFLHGNYITLTNLSPADWQRIEEQYLSPLYVSVHATEPDVRVNLMRNPRAGTILEDLQRLVDLGIELHTQAVLVPGLNDGAHLDRTLADLAALYPAVRDLSIVPVGLTQWHDPSLRPYHDAEAAEVLRLLNAWQARLLSDLGVRFVYPSDEWYLRGGVSVPAEEAYDGLLPAMVENGVGLVRRFLNGQARLLRDLADLGEDQTWITGELFAPVLRDVACSFVDQTALEVEVLPVTNRFFGATVTVAGLLTVEDVVGALKDRGTGGAIVLPGEIFRGPEGRSLDGYLPEDVARATDRKVYVIAQHGSSAHFTLSDVVL